MADPKLLAVRGRTFVDPAAVLRLMREIEYGVAASDTPELIKRLRTGRLKNEREARTAALFAYGMAQVVGTKVYVSPGEVSDADLLTLCRTPSSDVVTLVQLKELVPADLNAAATLPDVIASVQGRPASDTVLAVHLNRRETIPVEELSSYRVPFAELWFFWCSSPDQTEWHLFGDAMRTPSAFRFEYPS